MTKEKPAEGLDLQESKKKGQEVEDWIDDVAIGTILEARAARDFIESKGLLDEWGKYCEEHLPEFEEYLKGLLERLRKRGK